MGPTDSLIAMRASNMPARYGPRSGYASARIAAKPIATPACETRPIHTSRDSSGGAPAHRAPTRDAELEKAREDRVQQLGAVQDEYEQSLWQVVQGIDARCEDGDGPPV